MTAPGDRPELTEKQRDEREALRVLRQGTEPAGRWRELALMFVVLGGLMLAFRVLVTDDGVSEALIFSVGYALTFVLVWSWPEQRRRATRASARGADALELGVVTAKEDGYVTVRGDQHEVSWRPDSGFRLSPGTVVWAAPRIAPDERIVLVRADRSYGLAQDVVGARTEAVDVHAPPELPMRDGIPDD